MKIITEEIIRENIDDILVVISADSVGCPHFHIAIPKMGGSVFSEDMSTKNMRKLAQEIIKAADKIELDKDFKNS